MLTFARVKTYEHHNERFFRFWAPVYDGIEWFVGGFRTKVVSMLDLKPGDKVLDVACGTGTLALQLEATGAEVTGVDMSPHMLRQAEKKLKRLKAKRNVNLEFIQHDARYLPFADGTFDAAMISFALHDMPHDIQVGVLGEMSRVVRPSGRIVVADYRRPTSMFGRWLAHLFISTYETRYYRRFMKTRLEDTLDEAGLKIKDEKRIIIGMGRILEIAN